MKAKIKKTGKITKIVITLNDKNEPVIKDFFNNNIIYDIKDIEILRNVDDWNLLLNHKNEIYLSFKNQVISHLSENDLIDLKNILNKFL